MWHYQFLKHDSASRNDYVLFETNVADRRSTERDLQSEATQTYFVKNDKKVNLKLH
jgi:hypothetical protein